MSDKAQKSVRRDRRERVLRRDVRIHGDVLALLVRAPTANAHVVPGHGKPGGAALTLVHFTRFKAPLLRGATTFHPTSTHYLL